MKVTAAHFSALGPRQGLSVCLCHPRTLQEVHFIQSQANNGPQACVFSFVSFMNKAHVLKGKHRVLLYRATGGRHGVTSGVGREV